MSVQSVGFSEGSTDITRYFKEGNKLFLQSLPTFIGASILFWLISIVSFSFLMGPLIAGYLFMFVKKYRGQEVSAFDIFKGFSKFFPIVIVFYLTKIIISIGFFLLIIPGLIFISWFFFVELLILDKNLGVLEAMSLNKKMASKKGLWNYVILHIVIIAILNVAGMVTAGIGYLVLTPYACAIYAVAYEDSFNK